MLFGSQAWGESTTDSDIDLLVIVSHSEEKPVQRAQRAYRRLHDLPVPLDVLAKTRAEVERYRHVYASLVQSWLLRAQRDLATARKLSADPDPYLDTAIYHCQQAAEKSIKGFLVFRDQRFEKTHDIRLLLALAADIELQFSTWQEAGGTPDTLCLCLSLSKRSA